MQTAAIASYPGEDSLDDSCLLNIGLKPSPASALANRDVPISEWSTGHDIQRAALRCMPLTASTTLHELGPLIFCDYALHLEQQVVFRALAERPVQEHKLDIRAFLFLLYSIAAMSKPGGGVVRRNRGQGVHNRRFQRFHRARLGRTELLFDFRPSLLDGIEVGRIGW